jgi:copper binding plastocyanin/azurin family protein
MARRLPLLFLLAAAILPSAVANADNPRLVATVGTGDAFVITLRDANGNAVTHLDPGTYDVAVRDLSEQHNFHLRGPGVEQSTAVEGTETVTWTVTLTDGTYTFQCDPHASLMHGSFTVGNAPPPPPAPVALTGSVGPRRTIAVRDASGKLATMPAGRVVLTVNDRTKVDNFHLTGAGVNRKTGVAFRGKAKWSLTLQPGRYTYRSDKHKTLRGSFTVTAPA